MSPRNQRHGFTAAALPEVKTPPPALPLDLVLEIVARSDVTTLLCCAACCKALRRDILRPAFIRRVCRGQGATVPAHLLCFLQSLDVFLPPATSKASPPPPPPPFSLAHPAMTPAAAYLSERHLAPFVSRDGAAADLLARYEPVTSRRGLVVLCRRHHADVPRELGICEYAPMSGGRALLPDPPEMAGYSTGDGFRTYVLLTASDGIGCSFLLAVDFTMLLYAASSVNVLTVFSPDAAGFGGSEWSPITSAATHLRSHCIFLHADCSAVVLGSAVHWVMIGGRDRLQVLTYDVRAATAGSIELPMDRFPKSYREGDINLRLASSPDGKLTVLVRDRLTISVWRLLSTGAAGWERHAVIDTEATLRSLALELLQSWSWRPDERILLVYLGKRSGVVTFELLGDREERLIALDVETKEMHMMNRQEDIQVFPLEVDLESRLSAMKTF